MRNKDDDNNYEKKDLFGIMRESKTSTKKKKKEKRKKKNRGKGGNREREKMKKVIIKYGITICYIACVKR